MIRILGRILSGVLAAVVLLALGVVGAAGSAWLHLQQAVGREAFGDLVSVFVSSQIPGEFRLSGVTNARLPDVSARRLAAWTPEGREVLDLRDVGVQMDVYQTAYNGGFAIHHGHVGGGEIRIDMSPNKKPWIERAFDYPYDRPPPPVQPPGDDMLQLVHIDFESLDVVLGLGPGQEARLEDASGQARITLRQREDVEMRYLDVRGHASMTSDLIPSADLYELDLAVDPKREGGLVFFTTRMDALGGEGLALAGHAPRADGEGARICMWTNGRALAWMFGASAEVATMFMPDVSFDMRPSAPPDMPRCEEDA